MTDTKTLTSVNKALKEKFKGRKLVFDSRNGNVGVVKVHALRETDWNA